MSDFLIIIFVALFGSMTLAALIGTIIKNTSVVDVFWGLGIAVAAVSVYTVTPQSAVYSLFLLLIGSWGLRLGLFLFFTRTLKGKQDRRYTAFEKNWGNYKAIRVFLHFYLQASLQFVLCIAFYPFYLSQDLTLGPVQYVASCIFILALIGQSIADWQLYTYKSMGNSGIYRKGLWSISRHPNLFFEFVMWVSISLFSFSYSGHIVTWIAPITVWIIIRFMTGPFTEKLSMSKHKHVYQAYKNEVPMIVPKLSFVKKKALV